MSPVEIASATVAVVTPIGAGIAWLWSQIDKRITSLENKIDACEKREDAGQERRAVQLTVIEILWQRLDQLEPGSPALVRAKELLDGLKKKNLEDQQTDPDQPAR